VFSKRRDRLSGISNSRDTSPGKPTVNRFARVPMNRTLTPPDFMALSCSNSTVYIGKKLKSISSSVKIFRPSPTKGISRCAPNHIPPTTLRRRIRSYPSRSHFRMAVRLDPSPVPESAYASPGDLTTNHVMDLMPLVANHRAILCTNLRLIRS
jgi:hypothetical protein